MITRRSLLLAIVLAALSVAFSTYRPPMGPHPSADEPQASVLSPTINWQIGFKFLISNENLLVEVNPAVAYNSTRSEYLAVWFNDRPGNDDIRAQRIGRNGQLVGPPFYISAADQGIDRRYPDVAYNVNADQYLVVWEHQEVSSGYSIRGRRVSGTGLVLDASDIVIRGAGYNLYTPATPAVAYAYSSDKYMVVWEETNHTTPISTGIYGQKVLANGALDGSEITIAQESSGQSMSNPDLGYNLGRNEHLVAWEQYSSVDHLTDIYARRVTGDGLPLFPESTRITYFTVSTSAPAVAAIPIAPDGQYLVAYELHYSGSDWDIYGCIVSPDQVPSPYFGIAATNDDERAPSVAGSLQRGQYLVVWSQLSSAPFRNLEGRFVTPAGGLVGNQFYLGGVLVEHPAVAAGPAGDFLSVFDDTPPAADKGIYGQLVGSRIYIPMVNK